MHVPHVSLRLQSCILIIGSGANFSFMDFGSHIVLSSFVHSQVSAQAASLLAGRHTEQYFYGRCPLDVQ